MTVIILGIQPVGSCLLHLIGNGSAHLARYTWPFFHLNADLVKSTLPPLRNFKKKRNGGSAEFTRSAFKWKDGQVYLAKCAEPLPIR